MENILMACPKQVPQPAVQYAAEQLLQAAETVGPATQDRLHACLDPTYTDGIRLTAVVKTAITQQITQVQGGLKGPAINAVEAIDEWAGYAIRMHYPLDIPGVQRQFAYFLLAVVTEGFKGEDVTGTQIGNYTHGEWGGFMKMGK